MGFLACAWCGAALGPGDARLTFFEVDDAFCICGACSLRPIRELGETGWPPTQAVLTGTVHFDAWERELRDG